MPLTLAVLKSHLNLEADDNSEDAYLTLLLNAAKSACSNYCNRVIYWDEDRPEDSSLVPDGALDVCEDLQVGALMMAGHLYENRELVSNDGSIRKVPMTIDLLWAPYRLISIGVG